MQPAIGLIFAGLAGTLCSCKSPVSAPPVPLHRVLPSSFPASAAVRPPSAVEVAAAERAVHRDSRNVTSRIRLADLYLRVGKQPEAARELRAAIRLQPRTAEAYRRLAVLYRDAGYPDREYEALRALAVYAPDDWRSLLRLTDVALEQEWFDIAIPTLKQAARAAPREPPVFIRQTSLNFLRHDWPQMEASARQGLKLAPDNADLWVALSDACRLQEHFSEAEQTLRTAIAHTTQTAILVRQYARMAHLLLESGWKPARAAEAERAARTALQQSPEDVEACYWLARAQELQGHVSEAETNYLRAAKHDIQFERLPFFLGSLYLRSTDLNKRREGKRLLALYQVIQQNTSEFFRAGQFLHQRLNDYAAHRSMAEWYLKVGRAPQAVMEFYRTLELNPHDSEARHRLGQTLRAEGRISEAKQYDP